MEDSPFVLQPGRLTLASLQALAASRRKLALGQAVPV